MEIERFLVNNEPENAITECLRTNQPLLASFLKSIFNIKNSSKVRVKLICNWCSSEDLMRLWDKMSQGNGVWNDIQITCKEPIDYYVVINSAPKDVYYDKKKTIVFRMEPHMNINPQIWGEWSTPKIEDFFRVLRHEDGDYNNCEWHLSKTYTELQNMKIEKNCVLSTVLSNKYTDPGHMKRIDFVRFLDEKGLDIDVFGSNKWHYKHFKGSLPAYCKDNAIFPYKYTFNVENFSIKNYFTEKIIDGILGECLVFYSGCYNLKEFIDERAFIYLDLSNFQHDFEIVKKAISEDWHSQRLPYIREAKKKILSELQFFPRLESIISKKVITLALYNGLCNRLLPLLSSLYLARKHNRKLLVFWTERSGRTTLTYYGENVFYRDLFEPIDGIEFISNEELNKYKSISNCFTGTYLIEFEKDKHISLDKIPSLVFDKKTDEQYIKMNAGFYEPISEIAEIFKELKPAKSLQIIINDIQNRFIGKMIGIHIRRTDGGFAAKNWTETDNELKRKIEIWEHSGYNIFVASDDKKYETFFGKNIIYYNNDKKYENSKQGIYHSIVDLFLLSKCDTIIGTAESTFSLTAGLLGNKPLWLVDENVKSVEMIKI